MSETDFHRDPTSTDSIGHGQTGIGRSAPPPPPVMGPPISAAPPPVEQPVIPAPPPVAPKPDAGPPAPTIKRSDVLPANRASVVPPPPPPRSTLPPVRPATSDTRVGNGIGSAKGVRWRGELEPIQTRTKPSSTVADSDQVDDLSDPGTDRRGFTAPPWLVSLVIHLIFLLVLALITTPVGSGIGKMILTIGQNDGDKKDEIVEFEILSNDTEFELDSMVESDFDTEVDTELPTVFETAATEMTPELVPLAFGDSASEIAQPMFGGRTGAMKASLLAKFGGTAETQEAVKRGLEWLKRNQSRKGGWSMKGPYRDGNHAENEASATAMAMLAFLGDGHTHRSGDYTDEMEKAMKYLVSLQDRSGFMAGKARGHEQMYSQAQATIALCEMYGMTKDSWLRPRAELAVEFAEKAQSSQGGWRYTPNEDSDTSVTGWFLLALMSAKSAGLEVNDSKLRAVGKYLDTAESYEGAAYSYQPRGNPSPAMTAEGLLCRQYLGWRRDDLPMIRGVEALSMDYPFDVNDQDVYYWYYATQMLHHFGGSPWRNWNETMKVELPKMQTRGGREDGSWPPQGDAYGSYGRIYTTCLSIYCLEVYYRHLPLYQVQE
ncbi:hypothetical protein Poly51_35770 [Rubripirellula tenax]|uniref:Squalene cyclase C-terminal domain-containing protein n=1 Tax=Rubripirellula tenax TaxID=2528015 RepID=A0A5C6F360_9BACT|nr:prenyltransferase/squalene oxidase repeat-containing protein [Rubripirellula tenax]TWU54857.1 hypothetical protein Poly51_35770 [Rubripirellula tenax]